MDLKQLVKSWLLIALGVLIASATAQGIQYESNGSLFIAAILLSLCNVFLKPLLMLFSLPFIVLTFGLGIWLINALLFLLVGNLVAGFEVESFWHALWGAFVVSVTSLGANLLFGSNSKKSGVNIRVSRGSGPSSRQQEKKPLENDDDVIDI